MTGTCDVTTCADIAYRNISEFTLHRLASFLLKMVSRVPVPGCAFLENGIRYCDYDSQLRRVNSALQRGTNISKSET